MKYFTITAILGVFIWTTTLVAFSNKQPDFNSVWSAGYLDGWCYEVEGYCMKPIVPIPPLPRIRDTTYTIIYNRGFLTGLKANR